MSAPLAATSSTTSSLRTAIWKAARLPALLSSTRSDPHLDNAVEHLRSAFPVEDGLLARHTFGQQIVGIGGIRATSVGSDSTKLPYNCSAVSISKSLSRRIFARARNAKAVVIARCHLM